MIDATGTKKTNLTFVDLIWLKGRIEQWIRFGKYSYQHRTDHYRRTVGFEKGETFALVRWASNDFGTVLSRIDILKTVSVTKPYQTVPFVRPGGEILLKTHGLDNVALVLDRIDKAEKSGINPIDISPDYWRHVHNRIAARLTPRPYSKDQHQAWLKRRRIGL